MFRLIVDLKNKDLEDVEDVLNLTGTDFSYDDGGRIVVDDLEKAMLALKGFKVTVL